MRVVITNATGDLGLVAAAFLRAAGCEVLGIDARRIPRLAASRRLSGSTCIDHEDPLARHRALSAERSRADSKTKGRVI